MSKIQLKFEYSCSDHTILVQEGFLEIDTVVTGLSAVSDAGFKEKMFLKFGNRCRTSGNAMDMFSICRRVAALLHIYFRVLCCS